MPASSQLIYTIRKLADDVYEYNNIFYTGASIPIPPFLPLPAQILIGRKADISATACFNFNHLQIPPGSTITSAILILCGGDSGGSGTISVNIHANDIDNAVSPTTSAGILSLSLTDEYVNWTDSNAWSTNGTNYSSPDISNVIQEVVDRPGWKRDNNLMLVITNSSGSTNAYRYVHSFDRAFGSPYRLSTLIITFTHPSIFVGQIQADVNDGYYTNQGGFSATGSNGMYLGENSAALGQYYSLFLRFTGVNIAQGSRIKEAKLFFIGRDSEAANPSVPVVSITGNDIDDAISPTNYTELSTLTKTSASASWLNVPAWDFTGDVSLIESADFQKVVEEIVARPGWSSGNDMLIMTETISGAAQQKTFTDYYDLSQISFPMRGGITHIYIDATTQSRKNYSIMYIRQELLPQ